MTDEQINLAIGAIIHAELVMDFPVESWNILMR